MITVNFLFGVTLSSCSISYIFALPFYLLVERPFKNFLDLILFPKGVKLKDIEDEESEEDEIEGEEQGPLNCEDPRETSNKRTIIKKQSTM